MVPKVNPVRRNARVGPLLLPAEGRRGPTPDWPLSGDASTEELALWARLWAKPQAVVWEQQGSADIVARYCRIAVLALAPDAYASVMAQATALEDRLGLTPKAMRALLWQIAPDEVAERRDERDDVRARMKALDDSDRRRRLLAGDPGDGA